MNAGNKSWFRVGTFAVCLVLSAVASFVMWPSFAAFPAMETWSMICGYLSFLLIGTTLLVGPIRTWLPARWTSASVSLRRDVGICAGLFGVLHVVLVLVLFNGQPRLMIIHESQIQKADGWLGLFFLDPQGWSGWPLPNWSLSGVANYLGLCAFLILLALLLTSFDRAEKKLGGGTWKRLHMANPSLFLLVAFHGLIYAQSIKGEPHSFADFLWFAGFVWLVRCIGFAHTARRRRR